MAKCPKCGSEVSTPYRSWTMQPYKNEQKRSMRNTKRTVGLFACSKCGKRFRAIINTEKPS